MNKTLTIFIATVCPLITVAPSDPNIKAAPENMLSSTNTPKPIGKPNLRASLVVSQFGKENFENIFVGLYSFFLIMTKTKTITPITTFIDVAIPQPTPPIGGMPK